MNIQIKPSLDDKQPPGHSLLLFNGFNMEAMAINLSQSILYFKGH
jgi:hypothetical protein